MRLLPRVVLLTAVLVVGTAASGQASPITVSAGETVIFNFDFIAAGVTPPPPYADIHVSFNLSDCCVGDTATAELRSELNGAGVLLDTYDATTVGFDGFLPETNDGVFSIKFSVTAGSITFDPIAVGVAGGVSTPNVAGVVAPEPATMVLLGLGVGAAGVRRWRQQRAA